MRELKKALGLAAVSTLRLLVAVPFFLPACRVPNNAPIIPVAIRTPSTSEDKVVINWQKASLSSFPAYPTLGSRCTKTVTCSDAGLFQALSKKLTEEDVSKENIVVVHSNDYEKYKLRTLRIRVGNKQVDAKVYDSCKETACGCCLEGEKYAGFSIALESYTAKRLGVEEGTVEWTCLDCGASQSPTKPSTPNSTSDSSSDSTSDSNSGSTPDSSDSTSNSNSGPAPAPKPAPAPAPAPKPAPAPTPAPAPKPAPAPAPAPKPAPSPAPKPAPAPAPKPAPSPNDASICSTSPLVNPSLPVVFDPTCPTQGGKGCIDKLPCRYVQ